MDKSFSVAGVSTLKGSIKVRFAKDMARTKVLAANGHKDIRLVQLPKAMTKAEALALLAADAKFQDAAAQAAIKGAKGEAKADKSSSNVESNSNNVKSSEEGEAAKMPSEEEKSVEKTPPIKGANPNSDMATASKKKREVPTDIEPSDASKSPSKKKLKTSNVQESVPPLKVSLDVEEKYPGTKDKKSVLVSDVKVA